MQPSHIMVPTKLKGGEQENEELVQGLDLATCTLSEG